MPEYPDYSEVIPTLKAGISRQATSNAGSSPVEKQSNGFLKNLVAGLSGIFSNNDNELSYTPKYTVPEFKASDFESKPIQIQQPHFTDPEPLHEHNPVTTALNNLRYNQAMSQLNTIKQAQQKRLIDNISKPFDTASAFAQRQADKLLTLQVASQPVGLGGTTHVPSVDSELLKGQVEYYYNLGNTIQGAKQQKLKSMGLVPDNLIANNDTEAEFKSIKIAENPAGYFAPFSTQGWEPKSDYQTAHTAYQMINEGADRVNKVKKLSKEKKYPKDVYYVGTLNFPEALYFTYLNKSKGIVVDLSRINFEKAITPSRLYLYNNEFREKLKIILKDNKLMSQLTINDVAANLKELNDYWTYRDVGLKLDGVIKIDYNTKKWYYTANVTSNNQLGYYSNDKSLPVFDIFDPNPRPGNRTETEELGFKVVRDAQKYLKGSFFKIIAETVQDKNGNFITKPGLIKLVGDWDDSIFK